MILLKEIVNIIKLNLVYLRANYAYAVTGFKSYKKVSLRLNWMFEEMNYLTK